MFVSPWLLVIVVMNSVGRSPDVPRGWPDGEIRNDFGWHPLNDSAVLDQSRWSQ